MPRILLALCLLVVPLAACGGDAPPDAAASDPMQTLALRVFEALKHDDVDRLSPVLLTADDVRWMTAQVKEAASAEDWKNIEALMEAEGGPEALAEKRQAKAIEAFRKARDSSAKVLDWTNAEFVGLVEERSKPVVENGVEGAAVYFMVRSKEREELFVIRRALNIRGVWMTVRGVKHQLSPHASMDEARILQTKQHLHGFETVIQMFKQDHGRLPTGMEELFEESPSMKNPYLSEGFGDAWGNPFSFEPLGPDSWRATSGGPDGTLGTDDDIVWPE